MKKPQWITIGTAVFLVAIIYYYGRTTPLEKTSLSSVAHAQHDDATVLTDTILNLARQQLTNEQLIRLTTLENSISRGDVKDQKLRVYHQLSHFWKDSARIFLPYAWYEAESARLENSENSLTFAARLFLENLQREEVPAFRKWEALQAKDLFERSLIINPSNDSARVGLGACYLFGEISPIPMEGINMIKKVAEKDSANVYARMMLVRGALMTNQFDKAAGYLEEIIRVQPENHDAILLLGDIYARTGDKINAIKWYRRSLQFKQPADMKADIKKRIEELEKEK